MTKSDEIILTMRLLIEETKDWRVEDKGPD